MTEDVLEKLSSDIDLWSDDVLADPYPTYAALRALGPVVWLSRENAWVVTHHAAIKEAMLNAETFTSRHGVWMNPPLNKAGEGILLLEDDPNHARMRRTFLKPLKPGALTALRTRLDALTTERFDALHGSEQFEAVTQLAHLLPLAVVRDLVGLSQKGKDNMLRWAAGIFDAQGPEDKPRTASGMAIAGEAFGYLAELKRDELDPGGWGAALFDAADAGELSHQEARNLLMDYTAPALDTTINGLSSLLHLLGRNPDQWQRLKEDRSLLPGAIDEALRLESPIRAFSRLATRDVDLHGTRIGEGDRVLMLFAAANRDERRYTDPDRFDVGRDARDHLAFGHGTHLCAGRNLGKLEIETVMRAFLDRIESFDIVAEQQVTNNTLRGLERLDIAPIWA